MDQGTRPDDDNPLQPSQDHEQRIRIRAYHLWEAEGHLKGVKLSFGSVPGSSTRSKAILMPDSCLSTRLSDWMRLRFRITWANFLIGYLIRENVN